MLKSFENENFVDFVDRDSGCAYTGFEFHQCYFESCNISLTTNPNLRSVIRDVKLINCTVRGCSLHPAIVEDVEVDGLKTYGLHQVWGAVFNHVILKGKIDRIMLSPLVSPQYAGTTIQEKFDIANSEYYKTVDWALDISEAQFKEGEIQGIPAHLIKRDGATQVVVKREKALQGKWRQLDLSKTYWKTALEFFLERGDQEVVLVAPKRHSKFQQLLDGLKQLRDAGVAEPD